MCAIGQYNMLMDTHTCTDMDTLVQMYTDTHQRHPYPLEAVTITTSVTITPARALQVVQTTPERSKTSSVTETVSLSWRCLVLKVIINKQTKIE